jgi:acyl carrier protein
MSLEQFLTLDALKSDLKQLIIATCQVKNVRPEEIDDDDYLINGKGKLKFESIDAVDIAVSVERRYGVKIKDISSARQHMRSVNSLAAHIYQHRQPAL